MKPLMAFLAAAFVLALAAATMEPSRLSAMTPQVGTPSLLEALRAADSVTVWELDVMAVVTQPLLTPSSWPKAQARKLTGPVVARLASLAGTDRPTASPDAPVAACPFAPDQGLNFTGPRGTVWWLVARGSACSGLPGAAALARPEDDVRRLVPHGVPDETLAALDALLKDKN